MKRTNETSQAGSDLTLLPFCATRIERRISPLMLQTITLPIVVNGRDTGVAVYIATSAFADQVADAELIAITRKILEAVNEPVPAGAAQIRAMFAEAFRAGWSAGFQEAGEPDRHPEQDRCSQAFKEFTANVVGGRKVGGSDASHV